jgi:cytochrome c biogenesis protein
MRNKNREGNSRKTTPERQRTLPIAEKEFSRKENLDMKTEVGKSSLLDGALKSLSSIRLGIYLLIILVVVSFVGTVIPQKPNTSPENLQHIFAPENLVLLDRLGVLDLFHASWFKLLLTLLGLNIVFASLDRFSHAWRYIERPVKWLTEIVIRAQYQRAEIRVSAPLSQVEMSVRDQFRKQIGRSQVTEKDGQRVVFAQRHVYSRLAAYGIHLSLLVIFAGGLIGLEFGYRGRLTLNEGESTSKVILFDTARSVTEAADNPKFIERQMPFTLQLDKAEVAFNNPQQSSLLRREDIQSPGVVKNWYCTLSIWENGAKVSTHVVAVNQPLSYRGFRFFQTGFDFGEGLKEITFQVRSKDSRSNPQTNIYRIRNGESFFIKEANLVATPIRAGIMPETDIPYTVLSLGKNDGKPPVQLPVFDEGTTQKIRLGAKDSQFQTKLPDGSEVFLIDALPEFSTTLQVTRDPGVNTVWVGCVLLMLGLMVAFYFSHQRVWALLVPSGDQTTVILGGDSSKNRSAFARKFEQLANSLSSPEAE